MYPYERLTVWRRAHALSVAILGSREGSQSGATRDVTGQLRRAAVSVAANIAEGAGSSSHALFARYLGISLASAHEVEALLQIGGDAGILPREQSDAWCRETREIRAMLFVLRRRVANDPRGKSQGQRGAAREEAGD